MHALIRRILRFAIALSSLLAVVLPAASAAAATVTFPVAIGPSGRYLVDALGQPFLLWADSPWSLVAQPTLSDAQLYLDDRRARGFNTVIVNLIEHQFATHAPADANGNLPFTGRPFATPNESYFADADRVIQAAATRNILVLLDPLYLGFQCGSEGWCAEVQAATTAELTSWGQYVGKRYGAFDNIVWLIGGDTDPTPVAAQVRAFVSGVRQNDTRHLFTAHNQQESFAITPWPNESWLTLNDFYTYSTTSYTLALTAYQQTRVMPFFLVESPYENEHGSTPQQIRARMYTTMLSGGSGSTFGNCPIWSFGAPAATCSLTDWKSALGSTGAVNMQYGFRLFTSRPWQNLVPDTNHSAIVAGFGTFGDTSYVTAARASDGATVIAYLPGSGAITVNLASVSGTQANAYWFNPSTAEVTSIGAFPTVGTKSFSPPASGDWVFVLDDSARGFSAPGSGGGSSSPVAAFDRRAAYLLALVLFAIGVVTARDASRRARRSRCV